MKRTKKLVCILLTVIMTVVLTGCFGMETKIAVRTDGTGTMSICLMIDSTINKYLMEDEEMTDYLKGFQVSEKIYEKNFYTCYEKSVSFASTDELKGILTDSSTYSKKFLNKASDETEDPYNTDDEEGMESALFSSAYISADVFQAVVEGGDTSEILNEEGYDDSITNEDIFMLVNITFDKEITYTNGTLSSDKKTASWKVTSAVKDTLLQASTVGQDTFPKDTNVPVISGVTNNKYYRTDITFTIIDDVGIQSATCNGNEIGREHTIDLDGKYVVEAVDFSGNKTSKTFYVDTIKPSVSGVTNGATYRKSRTIKFTDTYGVKSATLNGKKIKSGKVVSKAGTYTLKVKDKAGNLRTVRFKIKK